METDLLSQIRYGGIMYILLVIAITMHEYGHALAADKLGDPLPRLHGRVSINPLVHMDMLGTVILPLITIAMSVGMSFLWYSDGESQLLRKPHLVKMR
ncbi:MAG: site-2 protease family protein [Bacilli bacterium]